MYLKTTILVFIVLMGITFLAVENSQINNLSINSSLKENTTHASESHATSTDPKIKARFDEIANTPYDVVNYNCLNKSEDFADFLLMNNATDVNIVILEGDQYSHVCILWNGLIYDPTNTPPLYGVDPKKYYKALDNLGFHSIVTSPYSPEWKQQNAQYNKVNFPNIQNPNALGIQSYLQDTPTHVSL